MASLEWAMGDGVFAREGAKSNRSVSDSAYWQHVSTLLQARQYEQAINVLNDMQINSAKDGNDFLSTILAIMNQIGCTCSHYVREIERHQHAYEEAVVSEKLLLQQLLDILNLVSRYNLDELVEAPPHRLTASIIEKRDVKESQSKRPSLWQKVQNILNLKPKLDAPILSAGEELPTEPDIFVYCLGKFQVHTKDHQIDQWQGIKSKSLFKYLVVNHQTPIPLEVLMDTFWRENDPESARRNLYQAIYLLRQTMQPIQSDFPFILSEDGCYGFNPQVNIWLDSELFERYIENGRQQENDGNLADAINSYETADTLYGGDFLAEDPYEEWPITQRDNFKKAHLHVLQRLSEYSTLAKNSESLSNESLSLKTSIMHN